MILVVGGVASGKRTFARSLGFAEADMSAALGDACPVLVDVHELVRDSSYDVSALADALSRERQLVTCAEVGSGIVPLSADDRAWRDRVGKLSRQLADYADVVVRMTCGVPQVLKGSFSECLLPGEAVASDDAPKAGSSFFQNRACEYFPCHEGVDEQDFNCMFCYCPLYALGPDCGGRFTYTDKGRKNCTACEIPHVRDAGAKLVKQRYSQIADLARR